MASVCHYLPSRARRHHHGVMGRQHRRRATIVDVAAEAGVAPSTVSRSFTNPGRVNDATREHVLEVAAELGYRPNPAARALESGRTNTVALVLPDITNPYFFGLIKGAERAAAAAGPHPRDGGHPGEPRRRGARGPQPRARRRRVRDLLEPAARPRPSRVRRAGSRHAREPSGHRPGQRRQRLPVGHPADRRPPRVARAPGLRLPRRPTGVVVGCTTVARAPEGRAHPPDERSEARALPTQPLGRRRRRGLRARDRGDRPRGAQRPAGDRHARPAAGARGERARTTSA